MAAKILKLNFRARLEIQPTTPFHHFGYLKNISPWEQKIYTHIFFNKDHKKQLVPVSKMLKRFEKWGKWKGLAVHYVWENIWWQRRNKHIPWLEKLIRL